MKRILLMLSIVMLALNAFAVIELIEPINVKLNNNDSISIGSMQPAETLELVFYRNSSTGFFDSISIDKSLIPSAWKTEVIETDQTFIVKVSVPANEESRIQRLNFTVSSQGIQESFSLMLKIERNLLTASIDKLKDKTFLGETQEFTLTIINKSIASNNVKITSSLPRTWFKEETIKIKPLETKKMTLKVKPLVYGKQDFYFKVISELNDSAIAAFNIELNVYSSLREKFFASFTGFPFFSLNLMPYMLIDGLLALLG